MQLPIGSEENFKGGIDVFTQKAEIYYDDKGIDIREGKIRRTWLRQRNRLAQT